MEMLMTELLTLETEDATDRSDTSGTFLPTAAPTISPSIFSSFFISFFNFFMCSTLFFCSFWTTSTACVGSICPRLIWYSSSDLVVFCFQSDIWLSLLLLSDSFISLEGLLTSESDDLFV